MTLWMWAGVAVAVFVFAVIGALAGIAVLLSGGIQPKDRS